MIKANTSARALNIICNIEEYYIPQRGKSMHHRFRSNAFVVHSSTKYDSLAPAQSVLLYVALRYNRSDIFEHLINEPLVYAVQYIRTVSKRILFETMKNAYKRCPRSVPESLAALLGRFIFGGKCFATLRIYVSSARRLLKRKMCCYTWFYISHMIGSWIAKVLMPFLLSTQFFPLCAFTMPSAMESPNP